MEIEEANRILSQASVDEAVKHAAVEEALRVKRIAEVTDVVLPRARARVADAERQRATLEADLVILEDRRSKYNAELLGLDRRDGHTMERRMELESAIAAMEGGDPRGTLCDDLYSKPRLQQVRRRIDDALVEVAESKAEVTDILRNLVRSGAVDAHLIEELHKLSEDADGRSQG